MKKVFKIPSKPDDKSPRILVEMSTATCGLIEDALNSHNYWELTDEGQRNNGFSYAKGKDNKRCDQLEDAFHALWLLGKAKEKADV